MPGSLAAQRALARRADEQPRIRGLEKLERYLAQLDAPVVLVSQRLEAIEELERALRDYDGTLVVVTHDRRFLEQLEVTRTLELVP